MVKVAVANGQTHGPATLLKGKERFVVEHENGRIEDFGLVDVCVLDRGASGRQFQWRHRDADREGAARLSSEDFDRNGLRRPLQVTMKTGERQYWYVGSHAQARLAAFRYNQRLRTRQAADR